MLNTITLNVLSSRELQQLVTHELQLASMLAKVVVACWWKAIIRSPNWWWAKALLASTPAAFRISVFTLFSPPRKSPSSTLMADICSSTALSRDKFCTSCDCHACRSTVCSAQGIVTVHAATTQYRAAQVACSICTKQF